MIDRANWRLVSTAVVLAAVAALVGATITGDIADPDHATWRDPISYFGSPEAPHPEWFNGTLAVLGAAIVVWAAVRLPSGPPLPLAFVAIAGAASSGLAVWPIDCSPVDDRCEVMIRADVTSGGHDVHSYLAVVLFAALAAITIEHAIVRRRTVQGFGRWAVGATVVGGVGGVVVLIGRAFSAGSGVVEIVATVSAVIALRWRCGGRTVGREFSPLWAAG